MRNPFEKPRQEAPKDEESVEIDVSEFEEPAKGGTRMETPESIAARHENLGREMAGEKAKEDAARAAVADAFFAKNPFLKKRFEKDPEAHRRFREGLDQLMLSRSRAYHMDAADLPSDPRFQEDVLKWSFAFEEEEAKRTSGRRAA